MPHTYGGAHQRERRKWDPTVKAGNAYCAEPICLEPTRWINPSEQWDLAHNRTTGGYHGPAHTRCNRSEGATYGNRKRDDAPNRWVL